MIGRTLYFVAGEVSGDNHGAALLRSLRELHPHLQFIGRGGPQMKAIAGEQFHDWIDHAAVIGLWEVIKSYGYFREKFGETLSEIEQASPDAVVLIDYPGFNLRLVRALHRKRTPRKTIYYISPQVWAWNRGRITQMARWLDLMLCIFPFEADLYNQSGLRTRFVGHPMIEKLRARKIDIERDPNLVGLFPGSRRREIRKIFPILLETARKLRRRQRNLRFEIAAASHELAGEMERMLDGEGEDRKWVKIKTDDAAAIMQRAFVGIVASGSATLEAAYFRLPFVLVYKVSWLTYLAARLVVNVRYLGMPNVLANKDIVPEFIQHRAKPRAIAKALLRLMDEPAKRSQMISDFDAIIGTLGEGGASRVAAGAIIDEIGEEKS
jgi:lipid-A-disaccharide synthase